MARLPKFQDVVQFGGDDPQAAADAILRLNIQTGPPVAEASTIPGPNAPAPGPMLGPQQQQPWPGQQEPIGEFNPLVPHSGLYDRGFLKRSFEPGPVEGQMPGPFNFEQAQQPKIGVDVPASMAPFEGTDPMRPTDAAGEPLRPAVTPPDSADVPGPVMGKDRSEGPQELGALSKDLPSPDVGSTRFPSPDWEMGRGLPDWAVELEFAGMDANDYIAGVLQDGLDWLDGVAERAQGFIEADGPMEVPDSVVLAYNPSFLTKLGAGLSRQAQVIHDGYKAAAEFTAKAKMRTDELKITQEGYRRYRHMQLQRAILDADEKRAGLLNDAAQMQMRVATTEMGAKTDLEKARFDASMAGDRARLQALQGEIANYTAAKQGQWGTFLKDFQLGIGTTMQTIVDPATGQTIIQPARGELKTMADVEKQYDLLKNELDGLRPGVGETLYGYERDILDAMYQRQKANFLDDAALARDTAGRIRSDADAISSAFAEKIQPKSAFADMSKQMVDEFNIGDVSDYLMEDATYDTEAVAKGLREDQADYEAMAFRGEVDPREAADKIFMTRASADIAEFVSGLNKNKRKRATKREVDVMVAVMAKENGSDATLRALRLSADQISAVRQIYEKRYGKGESRRRRQIARDDAITSGFGGL